MQGAAAALEEEPAEEQAGADAEDDSKYLHGPDFERGQEEAPDDSDGAAAPASAGGEEAAVAQASASQLVPSFDEEDPDA